MRLHCPQFLVLLCVSWSSPDELVPVSIPCLLKRCPGGSVKVGLSKLWANLSARLTLRWGRVLPSIMHGGTFSKITKTIQVEDFSTPCCFMDVKNRTEAMVFVCSRLMPWAQGAALWGRVLQSIMAVMAE